MFIDIIDTMNNFLFIESLNMILLNIKLEVKLFIFQFKF